LTAPLRGFVEGTAQYFDFLAEDRRLDVTLERATSAIRTQAWPLYDS
jgi:hypothetical protein